MSVLHAAYDEVQLVDADSTAASDEALSPDRWNRALLAAIQTTQSVVYAGVVRQLRCVCFQLDGCSVSGSAYLVGSDGEANVSALAFLPTTANTPIPEVDPILLHERVILHALQTAYPLRLNGLNVFVHTLHISASSYDRVAKVYLMGRTEPVQPNDLERHERPPAVLQEFL